jgi:hypothetical protein
MPFFSDGPLPRRAVLLGWALYGSGSVVLIGAESYGGILASFFVVLIGTEVVRLWHNWRLRTVRAQLGT